MPPRDTDAHYHVKVGPNWHRVDRQTGRHEVVSREGKLPDDAHTIVKDDEGCDHYVKPKGA
jgi:hypothetical protein